MRYEGVSVIAIGNKIMSTRKIQRKAKQGPKLTHRQNLNTGYLTASITGEKAQIHYKYSEELKNTRAIYGYLLPEKPNTPLMHKLRFGTCCGTL